MNIKLTIAYDGTNYAGWQRQTNAVAVQEKIEEALFLILKRTVTIQGASRTDAGVHAKSQCATFDSTGLNVPLNKLPQVINGLLPQDISITGAEIVPENFNPRFNAGYKTYTYKIYNAPHPNPLLLRYAAFEPRKLNIAAMKKAATEFIGRHDFAAFCATGSSAKTTVREVYNCQIKKDKSGIITLTISGNAFLYNMVRIIAGTLLYVGLGKITPDEIKEIIASKDRKLAGKTMPPQGLTLEDIVYVS